jgi:speckle-type POZ protein
MIAPFQSSHQQTFYSCSINIKELCEEFRQPGKYKIKARVSAKNKELFSQQTDITSESVSCESWIKKSTIAPLLEPSGSLVLDVQITLLFVETPSLPVFYQTPIVNYKELADQNGALLSKSDFSDFKFLVGNRVFNVHRAILAAASPVFAKMFTSSMVEAKTIQCVIKDIEQDIFQHLLSYIYERKFPENLSEVAMKLYEAAHYYQLDQLKEICIHHVYTELDTETAITMFNWASKYGNDDLKMEAWKIIKR